ncbi:MAG TPA: DUF4159 domain-containing protein [Terriglobia bacterium]
MKRFLILLVLALLCAGPARSDWYEPEPEFVYARLQCTNRLSEAWSIWPNYFPDNPPWHHDYPLADEFFVGLIHELTGVRVSSKSYKVVRLDSDEIFKYPFMYLSEPGFLDLTDKEVKNLGEYIGRGGFIMADDFRQAGYVSNVNELEVLRHYLKLAVPDRELVRLDITHPIFHSFYDIPDLNMEPPYGNTAADRALGRNFFPQFWGMSDEKGNLQLIANYNNDIGDFWKYLDKGEAPLQESTRSIRMGIDYVMYALTH